MAYVKDIIFRMLPEGSDFRGPVGDRRRCPWWPPDLFAVAATLVELSGCYAKGPAVFDGQKEYINEVERLADEWRKSGQVPKEVQETWQQIVELEVEPTDEKHAGNLCWKSARFLLAVADAASVGMGFYDDKPPGNRFSDGDLFADLIFLAMRMPGAKPKSETYSRETKRNVAYAKRAFSRLPYSIASMVPYSEACVQPKSRTAQVGCTLRSLSHHLALLPPIGEVETRWRPLKGKNDRVMNLLLVPFPFKVEPEAFRFERADAITGNYFSVVQKWMDGKKGKNQIKRTVLELIRAAQADGGRINGVVFPELALDLDTAREMAEMLSTELDVELFVAGVLDEGNSQNAAYTCVYSADGAHRPESWSQPKHHRWCVDGGQLKRYGLSHILDAGRRWWEDTTLGKREVHFCEFRSGASLAVLVCEDLARVDPAQRVLRAVGPNLVIALLMDGPQTQGRWSTRAAMALADDPGSSVLSLSSLGMVRRWEDVDARQNKTAIPTEHVVAIWKEPTSASVPLVLPDGYEGLRLTLCFDRETNTTLDGRWDSGSTVRVSLSEWMPVRRTKSGK